MEKHEENENRKEIITALYDQLKEKDAVIRGQKRILSNVQKMNRILFESSDLNLMLRLALNEFLSMFACDRAWLLYPCSPEAATYSVPMEQTVLQWEGASSEQLDISANDYSRKIFTMALSTDGPVRCDPEHNPIDPEEEVTRKFHIRSQMLMAIYPKSGKPWLLGIHNCSESKIYSQDDLELFEALGNSLAGGLTGLLSWQNSTRLLDEINVAIWTEDYSAIIQELNNLRKRGVLNLRDYLKKNSHVPFELASKIKVLKVNEATLTMFRTSEENEFLKRINNTFTEDSIRVFTNQLCDIWDKKPYFEAETVLRTMDDREITVILSFIIPKLDDSFSSIPVCFTDITKQKKLEEMFHQSQKMDAIGQLAGGVAHDFNNALNGIMNASQLLELPARNLDEKGLKYVNLIRQATSRASDLTKKLLAFGRKGEKSKFPIDLHTVLLDTVGILRQTIDKRISIVLNEKANKRIILGDKSELESIFINLCINASHAMPGGGTIGITTENFFCSEEDCRKSSFDIREGEYCRIEVSDDGTGISEEIIEKIFDPFFTTKKQAMGTGLGLASVYGTVTKYNGEIRVRSKPGQGSAFSIHLPCATETRILKKNPKAKIPGHGLILFVDDEESNRITGEDVLTSLGYEVLLAKNGIEALEIFKKRHREIQMVIMDMIMPEMNGSESFLRMKEIDEQCKVIISSGYTSNENMDDLFAAGLSGIIHKPYLIAEVSEILNDVKAGSS